MEHCAVGTLQNAAEILEDNNKKIFLMEWSSFSLFYYDLTKST